MTSPFFGLDLATRALRANQRLVDISNQNIANANTPGYSRQSAVISETLPYPIPVFRQSGEAGQLGTGVEIKSIERARDGFIDYQYRNQVSSQGRWDARNQALKQVEAVMNEPSASGLSKVLTRYWEAWQEVANSPTDVSVRANLLEQGRAVADAFNNTVKLLEQQQRDVDLQITLGVTDVNSYATQIANLNVQISQIESGGMTANDLRDQRDLLVDKLSKVTKVTTVESSEGSLSVYIGGHSLVDRDVVKPLGVDVNSSVFAQVVWDDGTNTPVNLTDGKLKGLIESRDVLLQDRITNINDLASRIIDQVNSVHAAGVGIDGVGGLNFFSGTDATNMAVDSTLTANRVAAARMYSDGAGGYTHAVGDSSNAVALAQLQGVTSQRTAGLASGSTVGASTVLGVDLGRAASNTTFSFQVTPGAPPSVQVSNDGGTTWSAATLSVASNQPDGTPATNNIITIDSASLGVRVTVSSAVANSLSAALAGLNGQSVQSTGPATVGNQYAQEIAAVGVLAATARGQASNQEVLVTHLERQREEVSGVSIDEEATHLIQYQHAYQAAARVISVMDSMLDVLINRTGGTVMRVTQGMMMKSLLHNIETNQARVEDLQSQITSGSRISKPSDDPIGAARALNLQESLSQSEQYVRNIDQATSWLNTTDSVLESVTLGLHRTRELATQAANDTLSAQDRDALLSEVRQIQEHMLNLSQSKYGSSYLFAGTRSSEPGYTTAAASPAGYQGNDAQILREVAPGVSMAVNADARATFDPVFTALANLDSALVADDANAIGGTLSDLDTALDAVNISRAGIGAKTNRLDLLRERQEDINVNLTGLLSEVKDADMAEALTNFSMAQNVYQASLKAGAQALQSSLLDYLR